MQRQQETKEFIVKFIDERKNWKDKEQARIEEENRKIAEYALMKEAKEAERKAQLKAEKEHRAQIYDRVIFLGILFLFLCWWFV